MCLKVFWYKVFVYFKTKIARFPTGFCLNILMLVLKKKQKQMSSGL